MSDCPNAPCPCDKDGICPFPYNRIEYLQAELERERGKRLHPGRVLVIESPSWSDRIEKVVIGDREIQISGQDVSRVELLCEPGRCPELRVSYLARSKPILVVRAAPNQREEENHPAPPTPPSMRVVREGGPLPPREDSGNPPPTSVSYEMDRCKPSWLSRLFSKDA